ncbi:MAG TPA: glycosyltransferase [Bryobacteraceae bacterium]|nr:glycosyltransferase [Bryobacteraceae bacterium]
MTILSVGFPLMPVGPDAGGGAEQILSLLERQLVAAGHRSLVIAAEGSQAAGELIPAAPVPQTITDRASAQFDHREAIGRALRRGGIDLIHFHGLDFHAYVPETRVPMLATLHLPLDWYPPSIFEQQRCRLNCVSFSQAANTRLPVVPNGINIAPYLALPVRPRTHLLFLGRICPEKGAHTALEVAHILDLPLVIAGPVHPYPHHQAYFHDQVEPLLDQKRRYIGPVGLGDKTHLLASSKCLLVPSSVAETSSLVAMEAVASCTPVVAFRSGALPEVVDHGQSGFIVDSVEDMVAAVEKCARCAQCAGLSPDVSRAIAQRRFGAERMVSGYIRLYEQLTSISASIPPGQTHPEATASLIAHRS